MRKDHLMGEVEEEEEKVEEDLGKEDAQCNLSMRCGISKRP